MRRLRCEALVVGAGPAGLVAASELAACGTDVLLVDDNPIPGGQLTKQIHKFFGTTEHGAGTRGYVLADQLVRRALERGVRFLPGVRAIGAFSEGIVLADTQDELSIADPACGVVAVGASERGAAFPGWTLPGVMTAGAAQTFVNQHRVAIGERVLVVGAGNVGLIVAYQLHQAGIRVVAIVESQPEIGGWAVHASKVRRLGIPILANTSVAAVRGSGSVNEVSLLRGEGGSSIEETVGVDAVCLAVGLAPRTELLQQLGCRLDFSSALGGWLALHDRELRTTIPGWFVAGDAAGVEEAAVAMEEGRLAGLGAAHFLDRLAKGAFETARAKAIGVLDELRTGPFCQARDTAKRAVWAGAS